MNVGDVFQIDGVGIVEVMHGSIANEPMRLELEDGDIWIGVKTIDDSAVIVNEKDLKKVTVQ